MSINKEALERLTAYQWGGNIRELENVVERMVILCQDSVIKVENLPKEIVYPKVDEDFTLPEEGISIEELERSLIVQALKRTDNNQTRAARLLGMSRHTLLYRMEKYNINE